MQWEEKSCWWGLHQGKAPSSFLLTHYCFSTGWTQRCVCVCHSKNPDVPLLKCKVSTWSVDRRQVSLQRRRLPKSAGLGQSAFRWITAKEGGRRFYMTGGDSIFGHLIGVSSWALLLSKVASRSCRDKRGKISIQAAGDFSRDGAGLSHLRVEPVNSTLHLCRHGPLFKLQLSRVHHGPKADGASFDRCT